MLSNYFNLFIISKGPYPHIKQMFNIFNRLHRYTGLLLYHVNIGYFR